MTIRKIRIVYTMHTLPERWHRRLLRSAVHGRDPSKLRHLVENGFNVNMVISDVMWDTPLTYAVKVGYLEVVEVLVSMPECDVDQINRNKHSALDEAIHAWLLASTCESRHTVARRYRILKCLLAEGAKHVTLTFLDMLIFSALTSNNGHSVVSKLTRVACEKGHPDVKSALLGVLLPYRHTHPYVWSLLNHHALPQQFSVRPCLRASIPLENAILLIKSTNHPTVLQRVASDTAAQIEAPNRDWPTYKTLLKLLTMAGYRVSSHVMNYLYHHHADIYAWIAGYQTQPTKLSHLCRLVVRSHLSPSVLVAIQHTRRIPENLKPFLIFEKMDSSTCRGIDES